MTSWPTKTARGATHLAVLLGLESACSPGLQLEVHSHVLDVDGEPRSGRTACVTFQQREQLELDEVDWNADFVQVQRQRLGLMSLSYYTGVSEDPNLAIAEGNRRLVAVLEFDEQAFAAERLHELEFTTQRGARVQLTLQAADDCIHDEKMATEFF